MGQAEGAFEGPLAVWKKALAKSPDHWSLPPPPSFGGPRRFAALEPGLRGA